MSSTVICVAFLWHSILHGLQLTTPTSAIFFAKHIPHWPTPPSARLLSEGVLDQEADVVIEGWKVETKGRFACAQSDSWKNIRRRSIIASIMNIEYKASFIIDFELQTILNLHFILAIPLERC
jgi:hypothetical protein